MHLKELRGLPVIDPTAARKVGTVADYQIDPTSGRIAAIDLSPANSAPAERILAARIRRVGSHAVILTPRGGATSGTPADVNERWLDTSTLVGLEVMGDDGNRIGHLVDARFDQDSLQIEAYLLRSGGLSRLLGDRTRIAPSRVNACSRDLMMVATGRVPELAPTVSPSASADGSRDDAPTVGLRMPLKPEDRLPAPSLDGLEEREPVAAHRS